MLFLNNDDVAQVLTMPDTLRVLEEGHRELARGELVARPRVDILTETSREGCFYQWGTMEGSSKGLHRHAIRMKSDIVSWRDHGGARVEDKHCVKPGLYCGLVFLLDTETGEPLAIMNDGYLQHIRVGALAGLGAKYLAKRNTSVVGMLGAGGMARTHLEAFAAVRPIKRCQVYCPTPAHREAYARKMSEQLDLEVVPCGTAAEAVHGADILSACTNAVQPIVFNSIVEAGMHLTCVSGEIAPEVVSRIDVAVGGGPVSQIFRGNRIDQSRGFPTYLAGEATALERARDGARPARGETRGRTPRLVPLNELMEGAPGRRSDREISCSGGVAGADAGEGKQGLQFVTVASLIYDHATAAGLGRTVPTEWFLQDIRD